MNEIKDYEIDHINSHRCWATHVTVFCFHVHMWKAFGVIGKFVGYSVYKPDILHVDKWKYIFWRDSYIETWSRVNVYKKQKRIVNVNELES